MPRFAGFAILALMGLGGCNYTIYHQSGKTPAQRDRAITSCEVSALRKAPVASQIRYTPRRLEERKICDPQGNCLTETYWAGGEPYTIDPNEALREKLKQQCMQDLGYQPVSLPACQKDQSVRISPTMGEVGQQSCLARDGAGRLQLATPI